LGVALCASGALAQYSDDFEAPTYNASATGVDLNGQNGFYNPNPPASSSVTCLVFTYAGNTLGFPANPGGGGDQFVAGTGPGATTYARSELLTNWGSGTGMWKISFDTAAIFTGTLPTTQNLGSWSTAVLPDPLAPDIAAFIALARWTDVNTAATWNADYLYYNAAGGYVIGPVPDPGFQDLMTNHWYRWSTTVDFDTNQITEMSVTDLSTGAMVTHNPVDWYLGGGSAGGLAPPTGYRFFAGSGTVAGNTLAFDNLDIEEAGGCVGDLNGDGSTDLTDLGILLADFGCMTPPGPCVGDLNGDGNTDLTDLGILLADFGCTP
jgi:hypothetical protein